MNPQIFDNIRNGKLPIHIDPATRKYYVINDNEQIELTQKEAEEFDAPGGLSHQIEDGINIQEHHMKEHTLFPKIFLQWWDKLMNSIGLTKGH